MHVAWSATVVFLLLNTQVEVSCTECHTSFQHALQYAKGDPRNIALLGHWDGFKPFRSTGQHGCGKTYIYRLAMHVINIDVTPISLQYTGSIEVSIATMKKAERSKTNEVYVLGFVPCYILPHKRPCLLDPFLQPLICEIEDAFINGAS